MLHLALHFLVPGAISTLCYQKEWIRSYLLMMSTMVIDLDHLLAHPIYDPTRCSIGFHPLHEPWLCVVYVALCLPRFTRLIGIGLVVHVGLDAIDCQVTGGIWIN